MGCLAAVECGQCYTVTQPCIPTCSHTCTHTCPPPQHTLSDIRCPLIAPSPLPLQTDVEMWMRSAALLPHTHSLHTHASAPPPTPPTHQPIHPLNPKTPPPPVSLSTSLSQADVEKCMRNAATLQSMLLSAGIKTMLNELSNTVVFERPMEEDFVRKWQLACEGDIAHVVVMPNIGIDKLEEFVQV